MLLSDTANECTRPKTKPDQACGGAHVDHVVRSSSRMNGQQGEAWKAGSSLRNARLGLEQGRGRQGHGRRPQVPGERIDGGGALHGK